MLTPIFERAEYAGSTQNLAAIGSVDKDMIFADSIDLQTPTLTGDITNGYAASLDVKVDTATTPSAGGGGMGGGLPPAGGPPPSAPS